jgi:AcrR family transcriptional regulator
MDEGDLRWVHAPQQDRSKRTLTRLLDAAEEIIRTRGAAALTVPAVAQAARSSVGSFYARFPDKAALLRTLHERACEQSMATTAAALDPRRWEGVPTAELVRGFVAFAVRLYAERRPMMLAFSTELAQDPGFAERRAHCAAGIAAALQGLLLGRHGDIGHPDPARAIDMSLRLVTAVLEQRNGLEGGSPSVPPSVPPSGRGGGASIAVADQDIAAELTRAVLAYLEVRAGH